MKTRFHILYIDDHAKDRFMVSQLLNRRFSVTEASGADALTEWTGTSDPDLVLAAVNSNPGATPAHLAIIQDTFPSVPVILLADVMNFSQFQPLIAEGTTDVILKTPASLLGLQETLNRFISQHKGSKPDPVAGDLPDILETLVQQRDSFWELITENISDIVWISDMNLNLIYVSRSVQKILGVTVEDHLTRTLEQKHPPESLARIRAMLQEELARENDPMVDKNRSKVIDVQHYHDDGRLLWISMHVTFIRDKKGKAIAIEGITRDITELKKTEEALQRSEALMRNMFELAPAAIGVVTHRVMTEVNPMMCTMLGFSKSELLGQSSRMIYPSQEEYDYVGKEKYEQIEQTGKGVVETRWVRKDGKELSILLASVPIDRNDLSKGVLFVALDDTTRKESEKIIRQQLDELRRWHEVTLGRESRIMELKTEVNNLLDQLGQPPRYASVL